MSSSSKNSPLPEASGVQKYKLKDLGLSLLQRTGYHSGLTKEKREHQHGTRMLRVPCSFYKTVRNENITVTNIFHYPTKQECRYPDNSYFAIFAGNHHTSKMILLSCAKTMSRPPLKEGKKGTDPLFGKEAHEIALAFAQCTAGRIASLTAPSAETGQRKLLSIPKFSFDRHRCATGLESIYRNRIQDAESKRFHRSRNRLCPKRSRRYLVLRIAPPARQNQTLPCRRKYRSTRMGRYPPFRLLATETHPLSPARNRSTRRDTIQLGQRRNASSFRLENRRNASPYHHAPIPSTTQRRLENNRHLHQNGSRRTYRLLVEKQNRKRQQLQAFEWEGFRFNELRSNDCGLLFTHE